MGFIKYTKVEIGENNMVLSDGEIGKNYTVESTSLPMKLAKRLEALGMTKGTSLTVLNKKDHGILIVKIRGTRFALGRNVTKNIIVG